MDVELVIDNAIAVRRHRSSTFVKQYKCSYANTRTLMRGTTAMAEVFRCDASIPGVTLYYYLVYYFSYYYSL